MPVDDVDAARAVLADRKGSEIMVWTHGGHYFRGILEGVEENGFLVLRDVSCTLAGERHERETVHIYVRAVDAVS